MDLIQPNLHYCTAIDKRLNTSKQLIRSTVGVDKNRVKSSFRKLRRGVANLKKTKLTMHLKISSTEGGYIHNVHATLTCRRGMSDNQK